MPVTRSGGAITDAKPIVFTEVTDEAAWTRMLRGLPTSNTYASWAWGEYKKRTGWDARRIVINDGSPNTVGCFQLQIKKLGPFRVLLVQGGLHLRQLSDALYKEVLEAWTAFGPASEGLSIVMINHQAGGGGDVDLGLLQGGFTPVLNSQMYTFIVDAENGGLDGKALSRNWRHNLKRAVNNPRLSARWIDSPAERAESFAKLESFYAKLRDRKSFGAAVNFDLARDLIIGAPDFRMVEAALDGEIIAVRVAHFCSNHVLDFLAASNESARNTYANYLLLWKTIEAARAAGKGYFDCGGINPSNATNIGVYNFKKGLGGRVAHNGPIWLYASSGLLQKAGRLLLSLAY